MRDAIFFIIVDAHVQKRVYSFSQCHYCVKRRERDTKSRTSVIMTIPGRSVSKIIPRFSALTEEACVGGKMLEAFPREQ